MEEYGIPREYIYRVSGIITLSLCREELSSCRGCFLSETAGRNRKKLLVSQSDKVVFNIEIVYTVFL